MSTVIMKFVSIDAAPERLSGVRELLESRRDVEHRLVSERTFPGRPLLDLAISGHPFRVECVLEEIRGMGVRVAPIPSPPFRYFRPSERA